jgi:23S rRNA (guanosine2251-2'-O)-methyltransferase
MIQLEGRNPVTEAIKQGLIINLKVERGHEKEVKIKVILDIARKTGVPVQFVNRKQIERLSSTGNHQGIIGYAQTDSKWGLGKVLQETGKDVCIVILDQVQDPHNLGAIIRTSEGAGVDGIAIPKKASASLSPTVHRVSMGGSLHVPVWETNLYPAIKLMKDEGLKMIAVDSSGSKPYYEEDLTGAVVLCFGGEDKGVSPTMISKCDSVVSIPMLGKISSLNVSVAAGVVLYERVRQMAAKIGD